MNIEKTWHAVYTRPGSEKKVAKLLSKKNIECYCALNRSVHKWADRTKIIYHPLFSSYIFVHAYDTEMHTIKQTEGVINFIFWLGKPAVIRDEEIDAIRYFLEEHEDVTLEKTDVDLKERVRVSEGPMVYNEGTGLEMKSQSVRVSLPSLGCVMHAAVRKSSVEIIQQHKALISKIA